MAQGAGLGSDSACMGFECWVQVGGEAQQLPGQQGRAGLLQDSSSVGGWSLGNDSFAYLDPVTSWNHNGAVHLIAQAQAWLVWVHVPKVPCRCAAAESAAGVSC
jgi:hypothetical protein